MGSLGVVVAGFRVWLRGEEDRENGWCVLAQGRSVGMSAGEGGRN